jgi:hypothetical protein
MYSIHYHIKMHESSLHSTKSEIVTANVNHLLPLGLFRWLNRKKA